MSATSDEREQARADARTALVEVVVPPLEAIVRVLTRIIDRLQPRPAERSLSLVGAAMGRAIDGFSTWARMNPQIVQWAAEVQSWQAQAQALGGSADAVDRMVAEAASYASEHGLDPMTVARERWETLRSYLAMGPL